MSEEYQEKRIVIKCCEVFVTTAACLTLQEQSLSTICRLVYKLAS